MFALLQVHQSKLFLFLTERREDAFHGPILGVDAVISRDRFYGCGEQLLQAA